MRRVKSWTAIIMTIVLCITLMPVRSGSFVQAEGFLEDSQCVAVMTEEAIEDVALGTDGRTYIKFVPKESATYYFCTMSSSDLSDMSGYLYDSEGEELTYGYEEFGMGFILNWNCEAENSYYIAMELDCDDAMEVSFQISKENPLMSQIPKDFATQAQELLLDEVMDVKLTGDIQYYKFTSEKEGTHYFYIESEFAANAFVFSEDKQLMDYGDCSFYEDWGYLEFACEKNKTYYIGLKGAGEHCTAVAGVIHPTRIDYENYTQNAVVVELDAATELKIVDGAACVSFTTKEAGTYYFKATTELSPWGYLLDENGNMLAFVKGGSTNDEGFLASYECEANTTYYMTVRIPNGELAVAKSVEYLVSTSHPEGIEIPENPMEATDEFSTDVELSSAYTYVKFTPEEDGEYYFYTRGNENTFGWLMDSSLKTLRTDSESNYGNFCIAHYCSGGETYYLAMRLTEENITESVPLPFTISLSEDDYGEFDSSKLESLHVDIQRYEAIAGEKIPLDVSVGAECGGYGYYSLTKDQYSVANIEILNNELATLTDDDYIQIADNIDEAEDVELLFDVVIDGKTYSASSSISVYPFLAAETDSILMTGNSYQIPVCQMREVYTYEDGTFAEIKLVELREDYSVTYSTDSSTIAVSKSGEITRTDNAKDGDEGIVVATYSNGTHSCSIDYKVTLQTPPTLPFDKPSTNCESINIYDGWSTSLRDLVVRFQQYYPEYADKISYTQLNGSESGYVCAIEDALAKGDKDAPDLVTWFGGMGLNQDYYISMDELGITSDMRNSYDYVETMGSIDEEVKTIAWDIEPGCFYYRTDIAKEVFGDASPEKIQSIVKDWDSFLETAERLNQQGYKIVNGLDSVKEPLLGTPKEKRVVDNKVYADDSILNCLSVLLELRDKGYTDNVRQGSEQWLYNFKENVFGYFGTESILNALEICFPESSGNWAVCEGPESFAEDNVYAMVTNVKEDKDLLRLFVYTISCDEVFMEYYMKDSGKFVNNQTVIEKLIKEGERTDEYLANNKLAVLDAVAKDFSADNQTTYDSTLEYCVGQYNIWENVEITTEEEALDVWYKTVLTQLPELEIGGVKRHVHTYGEWVIDTQATCVENGEKVQICSACGDEVREVIVATGHTFDEWKITKTADYQVEGEKTRTCTICGATETEKIAALTMHNPHTYGEWEIVQEVKCNEAGSKERICTVCGEKETEVIPAIGFVKGGEFDKGNNAYKITKTGGKKTVAFIGVVEEKGKVKIPKTVKIDGKIYSVTEIEDEAFKNNEKITSVTIEANVTKIGRYAFSGCSNLKTVTIKGSALTSIATGAFINCTSLKKITLPKNVKTIGVEAFKGCKKLKAITVKSKALKIVGKNAIQGIDKKATVKVPSGKLKKYKKLFGKKAGYKNTMKIKE